MTTIPTRVDRLAREQGMLTVGVVTKPFQFEGSNRMRIADAGTEEIDGTPFSCVFWNPQGPNDWDMKKFANEVVMPQLGEDVDAQRDRRSNYCKLRLPNQTYKQRAGCRTRCVACPSGA